MKGELQGRWWVWPLLLGVFMGAPTLLARFPPMADLATHVEIVSLLLHHTEPAYHPELYFSNWGHPNQLFHFLSFILGMAVGPFWGAKLVVFATIVGIVVGSARILRRMGRSLWITPAVTPITIGILYNMGLVANLLGIALLIWTLPLLEEWLRRPSLNSGTWMLGSLALLFFGHEMAMILFAGTSGLFGMVLWRGFRRYLLQTLPFAITVTIHFWETYFHQIQVVEPGGTSYGFLIDRWNLIVINIVGTHTAIALHALGVLVTLSLIALWFPFERRTFRRAMIHWRYGLLGLACFVLYWVMPENTHNATILYLRFLATAYLFALIGFAPRAMHVGFIRKALWGSMPLAAMVGALPQYISADEQASDFEQLIPLIEPGSTVLAINTDMMGDHHAFAFFDVDAIVVAEIGGRSGHSFTETTISPIMMKEPLIWNRKQAHIYMTGGGFRPEQDFHYYRYVIIRSENPHKSRVLAKLMKPEGRFVGHIGSFTLFESTLEVYPAATAAKDDDYKLKTLYQRAVCLGYLANDAEWMASDHSWADLPECQPAKRPKPGEAAPKPAVAAPDAGAP